MSQIDAIKSLNPAFKTQFEPAPEDLKKFSDELQRCIANIDLVDKKGESEEHLKSPIRHFFKETFYTQNEINTKGKIDLAVYLGKDANSDVGIVIEAKRPGNRAEFPTTNNLNRKALQELLLYYLRERIDGKNNNIKSLIITNGYEWFFFKAEHFYQFFFKSKNLVKEYGNFRNGLKDTSLNELFYTEIAKKSIEEIKDELPFVYYNFKEKPLEKFSEKDLKILYKFFSDVNLLGKPFGNDSNQLNKDFYFELLHIIGLEEVKDGGKKIIDRKNEKNRDYSSLLENTIFTLEDRDYLGKIKSVPNNSRKSFNVGLELCLTWVNRILFLKLLESQLLSYNKNRQDFRFLNIEFIDGFDSLSNLFFSALAKPLNERHPKYRELYKNIPYLNSSLFERSELEDATFEVSSLNNEAMEVYGATVLKDGNGKRFKGKLDTLEYLFRFLDAYDFSADRTSDEGKKDKKTLINASVLGLIFEKINGYKDGSFYTPAMITMFMCRETLRKCVVEKFKTEINADVENFDDVKDYCARFFKKEDLKRFNEIVNSIKICDPAVGSGHFLVSALNEMIAIKSELNILVDENFSALPCEVEIDNDELYISDASGNLFEYQRDNPTSLKIQKALFHEKETIIENCLFGVDLNPNSVNICRLRLWIELLKNAYYDGSGELTTLPNIDINIKCGNSLISKFGLQDNLNSAFRNKEISYNIEDYKKAVSDYKKTNSKAKKAEIFEIINTVKANVKSSYDNRIKDKVSKAVGEFQQEEQRLNNLLAFGEKAKKTELDKLKKLEIKAENAQKEKEEILNNAMFRNAFEWRFEFPEVLDDEGNFVGFDVILGNPPYIQLQKMGEDSTNLQTRNYETFTKTGDIYSLFYELGYNILKPKGLLNFITSNKWMRAGYGELTRKFFAEKTNPEILIDFSGIQIFDEATVDTNILMFSKDKNRQQTLACIVKEKTLKNLGEYFRQFATATEFSNSGSWTILSKIELQIKEKIEKMGTPLKDWNIRINYGIKTGYNEAFIIDGKKREELIEKDPKSAEIIRPLLRGRDIKRYSYEFADLYIIATFPSLKIDIEEYPSVKQYLMSFGYDRLKQTGEAGARKKTQNKWFETQDSISYWEDFYKQKIVWKRVGSILKFSYDEAEMFALDSTCFATGKHLKYLVAFLNSKIGNYLLKDSPKTGTGDLLISVQAIEPIFVPLPTLEFENKINVFLEKILESNSNFLELDNLFFDFLELTEEEIEFIEYH